MQQHMSILFLSFSPETLSVTQSPFIVYRLLVTFNHLSKPIFVRSWRTWCCTKIILGHMLPWALSFICQGQSCVGESSYHGCSLRMSIELWAVSGRASFYGKSSWPSPPHGHQTGLITNRKLFESPSRRIRCVLYRWVIIPEPLP